MGTQVKKLVRRWKQVVTMLLAALALGSYGDMAISAQCPAGTVLNLILGAYVLEEVGDPDDLVLDLLDATPPHSVLASEVSVVGTQVMRTVARVAALEALDGSLPANTAALSLTAGLEMELRFLVYPALPAGPLATSATTCILMLEDVFLGDCASLNSRLLAAVVQSTADPEVSEIVMVLSANNVIALFNDALNTGDQCEVCSLDALLRDWINGRIKYKLSLQVGDRFIEYDSKTQVNTVLNTATLQ